MPYNLKQSQKIEEAIIYITNAFQHSNNSKPVLLHSIRVAMYLYRLNLDYKIIIGALLHDIVEDTDITKEELEKEFGDEMADLVESLSLDRSVVDYEECYKENFDRIRTLGQQAILIRAADIIDNSYYYDLGGDLRPKLVEKLIYFNNRFSKDVRIKQIRDELSERIKIVISDNQIPVKPE